jgi:hypothetical protein
MAVGQGEGDVAEVDCRLIQFLSPRRGFGSCAVVSEKQPQIPRLPLLRAGRSG